MCKLLPLATPLTAFLTAHPQLPSTPWFSGNSRKLVQSYAVQHLSVRVRWGTGCAVPQWLTAHITTDVQQITSSSSQVDQGHSFA